jgi:hypothetical protein
VVSKRYGVLCTDRSPSGYGKLVRMDEIIILGAHRGLAAMVRASNAQRRSA